MERFEVVKLKVSKPKKVKFKDLDDSTREMITDFVNNVKAPTIKEAEKIIKDSEKTYSFLDED